MSGHSCAITYQGDGTTTVFPFTFLVPTGADLQVILTDNTLSPVTVTILDPSQYTISGLGNPAGGSMTYPLSGSPLAAGRSLTLRPVMQVPVGCGTDLAGYMTAAMASAAAASAEASAGRAAGSASAAQTAATTAATAAGNASGSATAATAAETNAAASATAAATSAGSAATSATNAATSATSASNSAASAGTSAANAAVSASDAAASATSAANSAISAGNSASGAAISASDAAASAATAAASAAAMSGTSATPLAVTTGSQSFTTQTGKYFNPGTWLLIASAANPANYLHGQVTAYAGSSLTVNVTDTGGSGTHADWVITVSGTQGPQGVQGAQGIQGAPGPQGATGPQGPGSVVSVAAGNGLAGGTITTSGTLSVQAANSSISVTPAGISVNTGTGAGQVASSADIVALQQDVIQNYLLDTINGAWAAGQYSNGGYDAFNSDTLSGVSRTSGQTYDATNKLYCNAGQMLSSGVTFNGNGNAGYTYIDETYALTNGATIISLGCYANSASSVTLKICKSPSAKFSMIFGILRSCAA